MGKNNKEGTTPTTTTTEGVDAEHEQQHPFLGYIAFTSMFGIVIIVNLSLLVGLYYYPKITIPSDDDDGDGNWYNVVVVVVVAAAAAAAAAVVVVVVIVCFRQKNMSSLQLCVYCA